MTRGCVGYKFGIVIVALISMSLFIVNVNLVDGQSGPFCSCFEDTWGSCQVWGSDPWTCGQCFAPTTGSCSGSAPCNPIDCLCEYDGTESCGPGRCPRDHVSGAEPPIYTGLVGYSSYSDENNILVVDWPVYASGTQGQSSSIGECVARHSFFPYYYPEDCRSQAILDPYNGIHWECTDADACICYLGDSPADPQTLCGIGSACIAKVYRCQEETECKAFTTSVYNSGIEDYVTVTNVCHYNHYKTQPYPFFTYNTSSGSAQFVGILKNESYYGDDLTDPDIIDNGCQDMHDNDCDGACDAYGCCSDHITDTQAACIAGGYTWLGTDVDCLDQVCSNGVDDEGHPSAWNNGCSDSADYFCGGKENCELAGDQDCDGMIDCVAGNQDPDCGCDSPPVDTDPPITILNTYSPDPTSDNTPTYTGNADDTDQGNSKILNVSYTINGGVPQLAQPADGIWDEPNEEFTFTPGPLSDNTYTFCVIGYDVSHNGALPSCDTLQIDTSIVLPDTAIVSPTAGSWQRIYNSESASTWTAFGYINLPIGVTDNDGNSCEYRVVSNGVETLPWTTRTCGNTFNVTLGFGMNCRHEGVNTCQVFVRITNTTISQSDTDSRAFSIDFSPPTYTGAAVFGACDYYDAYNVCWLKEGTTSSILIMHSDIYSSCGWQYLWLTKDACVPWTCPSGDYIGSYTNTNIFGAYSDWFVNDDYFDIIDSECYLGYCGFEPQANEWHFTSGPREGNFTAWTFMYDDLWWGFGYTDTGLNWSIDSTPPNASIQINDGADETSSLTVTLRLNFNDTRSGVDQAGGCRYKNDTSPNWTSWEPCTNLKTWTLNPGVGLKTVLYEVKDNVGNVRQVSDVINYGIAINLWATMNIDGTDNHPDRYKYTRTPADNDVDFAAHSSATDYKIWNQVDSEPGTWTALTTNPWTRSSWNLGSGDGLKTVMAKVRNTTAEVSIQDTIYVDTQKPRCWITTPHDGDIVTVDPSFQVTWTTEDQLKDGYRSNIQYTELQTNSSGTWQRVCGAGTIVPEGNPSFSTSRTCTDTDVTPGINYFRCFVNDYARNVNYSEEIELFLITGTGPVAYFNTLPRWIGPEWGDWTGGTEPGEYSFRVSWDNQSHPYDMDCFQLEWSLNNTIYYPLETCTKQKSIIFGPVLPFVLQENERYFFRVRANNSYGNMGDWAYTNTTIDATSPILLVDVEFGSVNITSNATDLVSGIASHLIEWTRPGTGVIDCGISPPGVSNMCNKYFSEDRVKVKIIAADYANNLASRELTLGNIVNFAIKELNLIIGAVYNLKVEVTNPESFVDNITLELYGDYPNELYRFLDVGWVNYSISPDKKNITIYNLQPYEGTFFFVEVVSGDYDEVGKYIKVNATTENGGELETDAVLVKVVYPAMFSGLTEIAILILFVVAVSFYYRRMHPTKPLNNS